MTRHKARALLRGAVLALLVGVSGNGMGAGAEHPTSSGHPTSGDHGAMADHGAHVVTPGIDQAAALAASKAAVGKPMADVVFYDPQGKPVRLSQFRGKPLVVSLIYTSCAHVCPLTTQTLADAAGKANAALGEDSYQLVTIGFDTAHDTPGRMAEFARRQGAALPNWTFLAGDAAGVRALADSLGFAYAPITGGFDHIAQTTVVNADGLVHGQLYGTRVTPVMLVEPLKRLVFGVTAHDSALDGLTKKVRLFCTTYDPASDSYRFDYSLFIGMGIGLMIFVAAGVFMWRSRGRASK